MDLRTRMWIKGANQGVATELTIEPQRLFCEIYEDRCRAEDQCVSC